METNTVLQLERKPKQIDSEEDLEKAGLALVAEAQNLIILSDEDETKAADMFLRAKDHIKAVERIVGPFVDADRAKWKASLARQDSYKQVADEVVKILKPRLSEYNTQKERRRLEEQRRLQEEARKQAEQDALEMAVEAEKIGQSDVAQQIIETPVYVPPVIVPKAEKPKGLSYKENWKGEVVDLFFLVKAVAEGRAPLNLLEVNSTVLNGLARSLKGTLDFPGIRAVCEKVPFDARR